MKKILLSYILTYLLSSPLLAQIQGAESGIVIKASTSNSSSYYFGEPCYIFFEVHNLKNIVNRYYPLQTGTNYKLHLKDLNKNQPVEPLKDYWDSFSHQRAGWKQTPPKDIISFQPNESRIFAPSLNEYFGSQNLSNKKLPYNNLTERLQAIPVGNYELVLEYFLFPSDKIIKASFTFRVIPIPDNEKEAFKHYLKSTEYACQSHFWGKKNYNSAHADSYENFIKLFPKSHFSQYAFTDMVTQVYSYTGAGLNDAERIAKFKEYTNYYPNISRPNLKMKYTYYLPSLYSMIPDKDVTKELDNFLLKIKTENAEISALLINIAEKKHNRLLAKVERSCG